MKSWTRRIVNRVQPLAAAAGVWIALTVGFLGCGKAREPVVGVAVNVESLLERFESIAAFAEPPWGKSVLVTSYDRAGGNVDWLTWTPSLLNAHGRVTLLNVNGAGYLSRIWTASFNATRWLFFFDGEDRPRLSLTSDELFGGRFPFVMPLAGVSGGGSFSMVPLPFATSLRVEVVPQTPLDAAARNYFQINYTLTDPEHTVESWPPALSEAVVSGFTALIDTLKGNARELAALGRRLLAQSTAVDLAPGSTLSLLDVKGAGTVTSLAIRFDEPTEDEQLVADLLRRVRLRMWWDSRRDASVDVPLGDFFGNPFFTRRYASRLIGRVGDTFVCRFPMPYARAAKIELLNEAAVPLRVSVAVETSPNRVSERYFHAEWRASTQSGVRFLMGRYRGAGHYIGCFLTAIGQDGSWNILEGDEIIRPDSGIQPPQFGTGLEDYFSGAYYYDSLFDLPFHGLVEKGAMRTDQYRFHPLDAVAFDRDFMMDIEFGDQNRAQGYMSSVVYWYGEAPQSCQRSPESEALLGRPADRFELAGWMGMLFLLERAGLWHDAGVRCAYLARRFAHLPWADLLRLRAAAYREKIDGFDAVREEYERLAQSSFRPAAAQAQDLLWLHEDERNALLGLHVRGLYSVWVNGVKVADGQGRTQMDVRRLSLPPGTHTWEIEIEPNLQASMFSLSLRSRWGDVTSAGPWEIVEVEAYPGRPIPESFVGQQALPNMTLWEFEPNAYVGMQSGAQGVPIWAFWDSLPRVGRVRLRQQWELGPEATSKSVSNGAVPERTPEELRAHTVDGTN